MIRLVLVGLIAAVLDAVQWFAYRAGYRRATRDARDLVERHLSKWEQKR